MKTKSSASTLNFVIIITTDEHLFKVSWEYSTKLRTSHDSNKQKIIQIVCQDQDWNNVNNIRIEAGIFFCNFYISFARRKQILWFFIFYNNFKLKKTTKYPNNFTTYRTFWCIHYLDFCRYTIKCNTMSVQEICKEIKKQWGIFHWCFILF